MPLPPSTPERRKAVYLDRDQRLRTRTRGTLPVILLFIIVVASERTDLHFRTSTSF